MDVTNRHRQAFQPRIDSRYVYEGSQPQDHNNFWENLGKIKILVIVIKTNPTKNQKPKNRENPIKINKIQLEEDHIVPERGTRSRHDETTAIWTETMATKQYIAQDFSYRDKLTRA